MLRALSFATLLLLVGCPKGSSPSSAVDVESDSSGGFIEISMDDEDEDLEAMFGSELMMATAECGDLISLEPAAMMGRLKDGEITCLDQALRVAERQTHKDKLSRVLLADAWAKGDQHRWESIARRHLEEIDRSDPDMCYRFALYVSKKGPESTDEALKWADVALENRTRWSGDLHVKRVNSLYRLKAVSAQKNWIYLGEQYALAPTENDESAVLEARNLAKTLAREWLEYARSAGPDPTLAERLCVSAAGTEEFCNDG